MSELNMPETWASISIGDASKMQTLGLVKAARFQGDDLEYPYIKMGDITSDGKLLLEKLTRVDLDNDEVEKFKVKVGDFLFNTRNSQKLVGKSCSVSQLNEEITLFNNNILRVRFFEGVDSKLISYWFKTREIQHELSLRNRGTTNVSAIYAKDLNTVEVPLPPKAEQQRIIQKIDSCFEKIDETEQNLNQVEILLSKYRESLLVKAFRGELVEQDPDDESVDKIYQKIKDKESRIKKKKNIQNFQGLTEKDNPFSVPKTWTIVELDKVCDAITCGVAKRPDYVKEGIPFLSARNVKKDIIKWDKYEHISEEDHKKLTKHIKPQKGDVLYTRVGSRYGEAAIIDRDTEFSIFVSLTLLKPCPELITNKFLNYYLNSRDVKALADKCVLGVAVGNLNVNAVRKFPFPLPSLNEQIRITDKLDSELDKINSIINNVVKMKKILNLQKESILKAAFEGRIVNQIEEEGTGQELLEHILAKKEQEKPKKKAKKKVAKKVKKKV